MSNESPAQQLQHPPPPPHKYFDDCESHGPRPRVPGQETRVYQMTEGSLPGKGSGPVSANMSMPTDCSTTTSSAAMSSGVGAGSLSAGTMNTSTPTSATLLETTGKLPTSAMPSLDAAASSATELTTSSTFPSSSRPSAFPVPSNATVASSHWHQSLVNLLDDSRGAELFKLYVEQQGGVHTDRLNFYFACEGLKQQTEDAQIKQMVAAIYKFLRKSKIALGNELRARIKAGLLPGAAAMDANIFNSMQLEIMHTICETTYPHFLQSDLYIQHLNTKPTANEQSTSTTKHPTPAAAQQSSTQMTQMVSAASVSAPSPYSVGNAGAPGTPTISRTLMTLHEDTELSSCDPSSGAAATMPLTLNSLLATEGPRLDVRPNGAHGYVGQFSSAYNPVSLQNSECMSVSSGGQRDPDTRPYRSSGREGRPDHRRRSEHGSGGGSGSGGADSGGGAHRTGPGGDAMHINHNTNLTVQNKEMPINSSMRGSHFVHFGKLTHNDLITRVLPQLEAIKQQQDHGISPLALSLGQSLMNTDGYSAALQFDDDNDQSILDKHVSRVWMDDKSPLRSPGTKSPFPSGASAGAGAGAGSGSSGVDMFGRSVGGGVARSAELDAMLAQSGDGSSGAFGGGSGAMRHSHRPMPERRHHGSGAAATGASSSSSSSSKITAMQRQQHQHHQPQQQQQQQHHQHQPTGSGGMFGGVLDSAPMLKPRLEPSTSRARSMVTEVACSNTLEEARRRLEDATRISRHYPQHYPQEAPLPPPPAQVNAKTQDSTIALYTFPGESVPYRYILSGLQPTLKQFKEILPKKGNFRFFFKTACDDPDTPVIQVEIVNDKDILPLFEGKVMGLAKPCENE